MTTIFSICETSYIWIELCKIIVESGMVSNWNISYSYGTYVMAYTLPVTGLNGSCHANII